MGSYIIQNLGRTNRPVDQPLVISREVILHSASQTGAWVGYWPPEAYCASLGWKAVDIKEQKAKQTLFLGYTSFQTFHTQAKARMEGVQ